MQISANLSLVRRYLNPYHEVIDMTEAKTKAATKVAAAKAGSAVAGKPKTAATAAKKTVANPTPEERYRMVQTAAYFIAEQHGFQGRSDEHWAAAERQVAAMLGQ